MSGANPSRVYDADFEEVADQRSGPDRRQAPRRAARQHLNTLFAATLLNHVQSPQAVRKPAYRAPHKLRPGMAFNLRA